MRRRQDPCGGQAGWLHAAACPSTVPHPQEVEEHEGHFHP